MSFRRASTLEGVKFAIRQIEDMQSSEAAAQSGATELSGVSFEVQSLQKILEQSHSVIFNAEANWEQSEEIDPIGMFRMDCEYGATYTKIAISSFMNKVLDVAVPDIFKSINPYPVNFFALHNLKNELQRIKSRLGKNNIEDFGAPNDRGITQSAQQSLCNIDDIWLPDLENHRKLILQTLVDQCLQTCSVIEIVGTKVFAKAVLAEKIYQSIEVKTHFEACFWLFPQIQLNTQDADDGLPQIYLFKPIEIFRKMLLKVGETNFSDAHDEEYHIFLRLRQFMNGTRCLVIVDNNCTELWTLINAVFLDGNDGNLVLITTAELGKSDYKYDLPFVNSQDSIKLLKELGKNDFLEFEYDKTLLNMVDISQWYIELPSVFKTCIAYMAAVFPCGSIVLADSLIRLWIVEGIIPHEEGRTMENIAESYIQQLVQRGLLRIIETYYHNQGNQPTRSIILDPSVHRIISSNAQDDMVSPVMVIHSEDDLGSRRVPKVTLRKFMDLHRLALHLPYEFNHISSFGEGPKPWCLNYPCLHSLFFFGYVAPIQISPFSFLRVLAVFSSHIQFPEEYAPCWLDSLINLRYLGFIVCLVKGASLGKTLDRLCKLEILDLSASIVSGLSEFIRNNKKVNVVGPAKDELPESWSPVPDMSQ